MDSTFGDWFVFKLIDYSIADSKKIIKKIIKCYYEQSIPY